MYSCFWQINVDDDLLMIQQRLTFLFYWTTL